MDLELELEPKMELTPSKIDLTLVTDIDGKNHRWSVDCKKKS